MSKYLSDFFDHLLPDLPGCPVHAAENALREAINVFSERTRLWRVDLTPINIVAGTASYALSAGDGKLVYEVRRAEVNGEEVFAKSEAELDALLDAGWRAQTGTPKYFYLLDEYTIRLVLTPEASATAGLKVNAALKLTPEGEEIDDRLFNEYRMAITAGAKAMLMASPQKPYSNPVLAAKWEAEFNIACGRGDIRAAKSFTRAPLRTGVVHGVR